MQVNKKKVNNMYLIPCKIMGKIKNILVDINLILIYPCKKPLSYERSQTSHKKIISQSKYLDNLKSIY